MKIGIDISQIAYRGTGVGVYTENLVRNVIAEDKKNEYVLFFSSLRRRMPNLNLKGNYKIEKAKIPPTVGDILWNKIHRLKIDRLIGRVDVFHSSDWIEPPSLGKKVTTIHDMVVYTNPGDLNRKIIETQKKKLAWVKKETEMIICVSKFTQGEVLRNLGVERERTVVIYEGVREEFEKFRSLGGRKKEEEEKRVREKYGLVGRYVLAVGTREPRKNLRRLVGAFKMLRNDFKDLELVIVGKYGWGEDVKERMDGGVKLLGYVEDSNLAGLYKGAEVFCHPSKYEGFGLPILEAMSCGGLVVCSNTSSLGEVGGKEAIYFNPESKDDIYEKIGKGVSLKGEEKRVRREKGEEWTRNFSFKKMAKETIEVYEKV